MYNKTLSVNRTVIYNSSMGEDFKLVRTGTWTNDSFLHSVMHGYSSDYRKMSHEKRQSSVQTLLSDITIKISDDKWSAIKSSSDVKLSWRDECVSNIKECCEWLRRDDPKNPDYTQNIVTPKNICDYRLVFRLLENDVSFQKCWDICKDQTIDKCQILLHTHITKHVKEKLVQLQSNTGLRNRHITTFLRMTSKLIQSIIKFSLKTIRLERIDVSVADPCVDSHFVSVLSDIIDRDIYIIENATSLQTEMSLLLPRKKRKSLILLSIKGKFEIIGLLADDNYVKREFDHNDKALLKLFKVVSGSKKSNSSRSDSSSDYCSSLSSLKYITKKQTFKAFLNSSRSSSSCM